MPDSHKIDNIKKISLVELNEILNRENSLLKNKKLITKLPDNGESIKKFRTLIENEIKYREKLAFIDEAIEKLSINDPEKLSINDQDKHVQKLCEIERTPAKDRFKPFSTLNNALDVKPDSKIFKLMEDCTQCNKPTKLILLPESINILQKQEERVKLEQVKIRYKGIIKAQENAESDSESSGSEENESDLF